MCWFQCEETSVAVKQAFRDAASGTSCNSWFIVEHEQ